MTDAQRKAVWAAFMDELSSRRESTGSLLKAEIRAALDAADQWVSDNATSYNNALPTAFKTNATTAHKNELLQFVLEARVRLGT
jgi:hypothetical protein